MSILRCGGSLGKLGRGATLSISKDPRDLEWYRYLDVHMKVFATHIISIARCYLQK